MYEVTYQGGEKDISFILASDGTRFRRGVPVANVSEEILKELRNTPKVRLDVNGEGHEPDDADDEETNPADNPDDDAASGVDEEDQL